MITQEDVIYFIVTDRFNDGDAANNIGHEPANPRGYHGGDLNGILAKTGYLKELGVTAVWITPVYFRNTGNTINIGKNSSTKSTNDCTRALHIRREAWNTLQTSCSKCMHVA